MKISKTEGLTVGIAEAYCLLWGWIVPRDLFWKWFFYFFLAFNLFVFVLFYVRRQLRLKGKVRVSSDRRRNLALFTIGLLTIAVIGFNSWFRSLMLTSASISGRDMVVQALLGVGTDVNRSIEMLPPPLFVASSAGNSSTVEILLRYGANLSWRNGSGQTALTIAVSKGHPEIAEILKKAGAKD